jgi:3D (Asp-Asp-Asp) domain-containing protein
MQNVLMKTIFSLLFLSLSFFSQHCFASKSPNIDSFDPLAQDTFSFREPSSNDLASKIILWATNYYLPEHIDGAGDYALRDMKSYELGPRMTLKEWCNSAMEGSVRITFKTGESKTFNYAGITLENKVDCSSIFKFDVSKTKFRIANGPYGDGLDDFILAPYRTLATDISKISPGTVLYIPAARGAKIVLNNGRVIIHDGYFFAGDKGGAIKENHVDVFTGIHKMATFFPWIKSNQAKTFEAYVISDAKIISELNELHRLK